MRELYRSPFFVLTVDEVRRIVTRCRTERGFATLTEAEGEYDAMLRALDQVSRPRVGLLVDMRPAPPRNDAGFESFVSRFYPRLYGGFRVVSVLVKTQAGRLQLTRLFEANGLKAGIFLDEAAAIAHLGLEPTTGERLRAGAVATPPAPSVATRRRA